MKTIEDLAKSRIVREGLIRDLGEIPTSILRHDRGDKAIDLLAEERCYQGTSHLNGARTLPNDKLARIFDVSGQSIRSAKKLYQRDDPVLYCHNGKQLYDAFEISGKNCRGEGGALSRFPQNIGRLLLEVYTKAGDTVVDPFAGHNSRMELCWRARRNYIGHDVSREFMVVNRETVKELERIKADDFFGEEYYTAWIRLHECDSRKMPTEDAVGDFTITSPPYWNLEYYGPESEQLGRNDYKGFLAALTEVAADNFRCLKPGAFCVWCVNDFRVKGKFYPYHEDTAAVLRSVGFTQFDIAIMDLGYPIRAAFAAQLISTKILPKRHEYALIFQKPGVKIEFTDGIDISNLCL